MQHSTQSFTIHAAEKWSSHSFQTSSRKGRSLQSSTQRQINGLHAGSNFSNAAIIYISVSNISVTIYIIYFNINAAYNILQHTVFIHYSDTPLLLRFSLSPFVNALMGSIDLPPSNDLDVPFALFKTLLHYLKI